MKVMGMERIKGFILTKLSQSCMVDYQDLEILQKWMPKVIEFLKKLHVNIEKPLLVTFWGFWYFLSMKNDA